MPIPAAAAAVDNDDEGVWCKSRPAASAAACPGYFGRFPVATLATWQEAQGQQDMQGSTQHQPDQSLPNSKLRIKQHR